KGPGLQRSESEARANRPTASSGKKPAVPVSAPAVVAANGDPSAVIRQHATVARRQHASSPARNRQIRDAAAALLSRSSSTVDAIPIRPWSNRKRTEKGSVEQRNKTTIRGDDCS